MVFKKLGIIILSIILVLSLSGCRFVDKKTQQAMQPVTLKFWGIYNDGEALSDIIEKYNKIHPNISIEYKKLNLSEYEDELINAFAEDRGPDIFIVHNTWMRKYKNKLLPLPPKITLPYRFVQGTLKKEVIIKMRTTPSLSIADIENKFFPFVVNDVVMDYSKHLNSKVKQKRIFGLPVTADTLVLYYNRDLLNKFGIVQPPRNWEEFKKDVKAITQLGKNDEILQSAVAFGTASNVDRYFDILSVLMMQGGAKMLDENGQVVFDKIPNNLKVQQNPAAAALRFYTDFANPIKEVYTWNEKFKNGFEEFVKGNIPFFFGYAYHLNLIRARAPELNFGISYMPQIKGNPIVNYANYWVNVVSKKTKHANEAWDFLQFLVKEENAKIFINNVKRPTALRKLVEDQIDDLDLGVFVEQLSTAKTWYRGYKPRVAEKIFKEMIDSVHQQEDKSNINYENLVQVAAKKVRQTFQE